MTRQIFAFPAVVNERAARVVAAVVAVLGALVLLTGWHWLTALLAVGFLLRVLGGPRFSPLGRLAEDGVVPSRYELVENHTSDYKVRTAQNVEESDATLILSHL